MDDAPNENPVTTASTRLTALAPSIPKTFEKIKNSTDKPSTPRPTTPSPITEPPANATSRPLPRLSRAACVVRTFALVATFIPIKPARPELIAPTIKEIATIQLDVTASALKARIAATTITKIASTRYSAFRNAIAPLAILSAIRPILSVPTSCLVTQEDLNAV